MGPEILCEGCNVSKTKIEFQETKKRKEGISRLCSSCLNSRDKRCSLCKATKPRSEFNIDRSTFDGFDCRCRDCSSRRLRKGYYSPGAATKRKAYIRRKGEGYYRIQELLSKYNMTLEDYNKRAEKQKGRCYICGSLPSSYKRKGVSASYLDVDHNHHTGKIRGLLCTKCNTGLGLFKDSFILLERAAEYLRKDKMEMKVLKEGVLQLSKNFHGSSIKEELSGWYETKSYLTLEELERLWVMLPSLIEEMKAARTEIREAKRRELEKQLKELK